jgi:hypothetical protein
MAMTFVAIQASAVALVVVSLSTPIPTHAARGDWCAADCIRKCNATSDTKAQAKFCIEQKWACRSKFPEKPCRGDPPRQ